MCYLRSFSQVVYVYFALTYYRVHCFCLCCFCLAPPPNPTSAPHCAAAIPLVITHLLISISFLSKSTLHFLPILSPMSLCLSLFSSVGPASVFVVFLLLLSHSPLSHHSISDLPSHSSVSVSVYSTPSFLFFLPLCPIIFQFPAFYTMSAACSIQTAGSGT